MGAVHPIRGRDQGHTALGGAVEAFLATLDHPESQGTRRVYASTLRALRREFGDDADTAALDPGAVAAWFARQWGQAAPATWNRNMDAIRSAQRYWHNQGWMNTAGLTSALRRRQRRPDRSRALSRADIERLLTRADIAIRDRTLWRMLYETAARSAEVLRLDVEDLDLPNRRARVRRKGGAVDVIVWQTGTARLLPRLLKGRKTGPVFLTGRRSRVELPPGDIDAPSGRARLSYRRAAEIFEQATAGEQGGPWTLHQLRHSALTHDAESGASTPMLMAKSGHTSVASLARYARPSAEALAHWQERNDPARRR
jgi:integrase/recombinase XerC/integrase/recombinase XerD